MGYKATGEDIQAMWREDSLLRILFDDGPQSLSDLKSRGDNDIKAGTLGTVRKRGYIEQTWDELGERKVWQLTLKGREIESGRRRRVAEKDEARRVRTEKLAQEREEAAKAADLEVAGRIADWLMDEFLVHKNVAKRIREGDWRQATT